MSRIRLHKKDRILKGEISLPGSKSIANRALIIQALCDEPFEISNLSSAKDTRTLLKLLESSENTLDAGPAGTTFRFMTAYLSLQVGTQILTGSERMKQRPIGVLVEALNELGTNIEYLDKEGYPPLRIHPSESIGKKNEISVAADISSQYISALLMIAPQLPEGLTIHFKGEPVSLPYIRMTLNMMAFFGIRYEENRYSITVFPQKYQAKDFGVEADWSAASYYYALAAISDEAELRINGLFEQSLQGDSVIAKISELFGVTTDFHDKYIILRKGKKISLPSHFEYDFTECPDIAQTVAVICAALGISAKFEGLKTLRIKETDRIDALKQELAKTKVIITPHSTEQGEGMDINGKCIVDAPCFSTYEDHRMAMALAPLALLSPIEIEEPEVVVKSYPDFWKDLESLGFLFNSFH